MSDNESLPGIHRSDIEHWIANNSESLIPPFEWTRLEGGHSNLTYKIVDSEGTSAIVRRPPLGKLLPKAHDMGREFRILESLKETAVPVPNPIAYCEDIEITGTHFYVMASVTGRALYEAEDVRGFISELNREALGVSFIDVLADLHKLEPDAIGLGRLGRPDAYVARQLKRWYDSWNSSREAADIDLPEVDDLYEFLSTRIPDQEPGRIVHGDYGLHNCLASPEGFVTAVLDWEISTLGDPLADLGYALNTWSEPGETLTLKDDAPTEEPGFSKRTALLERYALRSKRDVSNISFYSAFNFWKTACIVQGVYARYVLGQKSTEGIDLDYLRERIFRAARLASNAADTIKTS